MSGSGAAGRGRLPAMTQFGPVAWPPSPPIRTERLVLREAEARDHAVFIDLLASPEVHTYLGGPRARDELERELPQTPGPDLGICVVEFGGAMIDQVLLRRSAGKPAGERGTGRAELAYLFLPEAWGSGYAAEACQAALGWLDNALPGEPVVLYTQTANARSMRLAAKLGFTEAERFAGARDNAEWWFGIRPPISPSS
jgi:RimJ/RimL family protein N-acetyltransferase